MFLPWGAGVNSELFAAECSKSPDPSPGASPRATSFSRGVSMLRVTLKKTWLRNLLFKVPSKLRRTNFKTEASLWKRIKCLCPPYARELWKRNQSLAGTPVSGHSGFVFEEGKTWTAEKSRKSPFQKASFSNCFRSTLKPKAGVFKFLRIEERFPKAPFSWRISVDGRPNSRSKAVSLNFSHGRGLRALHQKPW